MAAQESQHRRIEAGPIAKFQRETSRTIMACVSEEFVDALEIRFGRSKVCGKLQQDRSQFLFQNVDALEEAVP